MSTIDIIALGFLGISIASWVYIAAVQLNSDPSREFADPRAVSGIKMTAVFSSVAIILMLARSAV